MPQVWLYVPMVFSWVSEYPATASPTGTHTISVFYKILLSSGDISIHTTLTHIRDTCRYTYAHHTYTGTYAIHANTWPHTTQTHACVRYMFAHYTQTLMHMHILSWVHTHTHETCMCTLHTYMHNTCMHITWTYTQNYTGIIHGCTHTHSCIPF